MRRPISCLLSLLLCGEKLFALLPVQPVAQPKQGPAIQDNAKTQESDNGGLMDPFNYEVRGRKDPFSPPLEDKPLTPGGTHGPLLPLQSFDLTQIRLSGVIWDVTRPRAIVTDPENHTHVLGLNAKLGPKNGYIAAIREGEIVVVETEEINGRLSSTSTVIKISETPIVK